MSRRRKRGSSLENAKRRLSDQYSYGYTWNELKLTKYRKEVRKYKKKLNILSRIFASIFGIGSKARSKIQRDLRNADYAYDRKLSEQVKNEKDPEGSSTPNQRQKILKRWGMKVPTKKTLTYALAETLPDNMNVYFDADDHGKGTYKERFRKFSSMQSLNIRKALSVWTRFAGIKFKKVSQHQNPDILFIGVSEIKDASGFATPLSKHKYCDWCQAKQHRYKVLKEFIGEFDKDRNKGMRFLEQRLKAYKENAENAKKIRDGLRQAPNAGNTQNDGVGGEQRYNNISGQVWLSLKKVKNMDPGSYAFHTVLHELGHVMGQAHLGVYVKKDYSSDRLPSDFKVDPYKPKEPPKKDPKDYWKYIWNREVDEADNHSKSIMSYVAYEINGKWRAYPESLMPDDIEFAKTLGFYDDSNESRGHNQYRWDVSRRRRMICLHDVSGYDSIDATKYNETHIDLRPGQTSRLGESLNVATSYDTWIEHVVIGKGYHFVIPNRKLNTFICRAGTSRFSLRGRFGHNHIVMAGGEVILFLGARRPELLECFAKRGSEKDLVIRYKNSNRRNTVKLVNYFIGRNRDRLTVFADFGGEFDINDIMI